MNKLVIILLLLLACVTDAQVISSTTSGETVIESNAARTSAGAYYWGDGNYGIITNGGGGYDFFADSGFVSGGTFNTGSGIFSGTLGNMLQTAVATNMVVSGTPGGTFSYLAGGFVFHDTTNGYWIMLTHCERWPSGDNVHFWGSIGVAKSTDGQNFSWVGEIIQPETPYTTVSPTEQEIGGGGNCFVGNWLYVYFIQNTSTRVIGVARCDFTTFMSQAEAGTLPVFTKWHSGSFSTLGLGGLGTPLTTGLTGGDWVVWWDVKYYAPASLYVMVIDAAQFATQNNMRAMYSYDGINWFGDDTLNCSGTVIYPTLFSPDAPQGQLGVTNYIFGSQTFDPSGALFDTMQTARWNLNLNYPRTLTATNAYAGNLHVGP
jgi:hypothetical protein